LANFTPQPAQDIFFGEHNGDVKKTNVTNGNGASPSKQEPATPASTSPKKDAPATPAFNWTASNAAKAAAARPTTKLTVYVVSSNPDHEKGIEFIFSEIPVRLIRLQATDFYTLEQGLYPGMGVDRVASLKAASALFGYPALVLDGGTAMTYTAADCEGNIVGGGILPGLRVKLASLPDYTGALPLITSQKLLETVQACSNGSRETLPVFARDTETAILSAVLKETAVNLKSIIQAFVRQMKPDLPAPDDDEDSYEDDDKVNRDFGICITGGDHQIMQALLSPNHSHVVQADSANPADLSFHVHPHKHLGTTGMQRVIWETYQEFNKNALDDAETVISSAVTAEMVPAEAAVRAAEAAVIAAAAAAAAAAATAAKPAVVQPPTPVTASKIAEESPGAASVSSAKRARNAAETDASVSKAKAKVPKAKEPKVKEEKAKEPKAKKTKVAAPSPPKPSSAVKPKAKQPIKKEPPKPPQPIALDDSTDDELEEEVEAKSEVVKDEDTEESPGPSPGNQTKYMDRRVAKHFGKDLYFGSVDEFYNPDGVDLWHVTYDDGDQEDFELDELIPAFEEYRKNKNKDPDPQS
jgi:pantothenate kinase type III